VTETDIKRTLTQYLDCKKSYGKLNAQLTKEIAGLKDVPYIKSPAMSGMPHGNELSDRTYQLVQRKIDVDERSIKKLEDTLKRLEPIIANAETMRSLLDVPEEICEWRVIDLRYFSGYDWEAICRELKYKEAQVFRLHNKAIKLIEKRWDEIKGAVS
jgi:hypothetical protein